VADSAPPPRSEERTQSAAEIERQYQDRVTAQLAQLEREAAAQEDPTVTRRRRRAEIIEEFSRAPPPETATMTNAPTKPPVVIAKPVSVTPSPAPQHASSDSEDSVDMFGSESSEEEADVDGATGEVQSRDTQGAPLTAGEVVETTDDSEGYYVFRPGETLCSQRYRVLGDFGRGVFSSVLRAIDTASADGGQMEVAIKMLRGNEEMKRRGYIEIDILRTLARLDPENRMHCLRLLHSFEDRGHLCLVTEAHHGGDLRAVLRQHGGRAGLALSAVRAYAHQLLMALRLCEKARVVHADVKLDNILISANKSRLFLADFGSALPEDDCSRPGREPVPYLASRWYRAPEVVLGIPFSYGVDMWSVACCLYELATNKVCFPGDSNNEMMWLWMQVSGAPPKKLLKRGALSHQNFDVDDNGKFMRTKVDAATGGTYVQRVTVQRPTRDLRSELAGFASPSPAQRNLVPHLADLLKRMFALDPDRRITILEALRHPFFTEGRQTTT
jgi:serine/threonine-protein kinase PRP4